ncbi:zinc finger CCCH-type with G patch domain-containing protein-like [Oratosquilla oratoria]|uniref:zinc finger CCCH-type with G patch domain-containing protein-like n=1 Tax=Oratosquilla oratoria TaxID=337810 RepID=UPI003F772D6B
MSEEDLASSIVTYKTQLEQIEAAIAIAGDSEKSELQELQANLLQLLELTLLQLEEQNKQKPQNERADQKETAKSEEEKKLDDEFALFQSEMAELIGSEPSSSNSDDTPRAKEGTEDIIKELLALEGTKCRAPFTEKWGGHTYHNGIILCVETDVDGNVDLEGPKVRVLFSQPTSKEMSTCKYFLDGKCHYSDKDCRFAHGTIVPVTDLKEFVDPDFDSIEEGSRVLARYSDNIWYSAEVQDVLEDRSAFSVKYDNYTSVVEVKLHDMWPIQSDEDNDKLEETSVSEKPSRSADDGSESDESEGESTFFVPTSVWLQNSLSQKLGDWEKYTTGIGSKLMAKMGYIVGTGLGRNGEGRVEPVEAYVYPQGVSLDRCMELKDAANGEDLFQVEKRLKREQKLAEDKEKRHTERLKNNTSVFDIINNKLAGKGKHSSDNSNQPSRQKVDVGRDSLKQNSTKELNRKNYHIGENVKQVRREIDKLQESLTRRSHDKKTSELLEAKMNQKKQELHMLLDAEKRVQGEQKSRRDEKKYRVF